MKRELPPWVLLLLAICACEPVTVPAHEPRDVYDFRLVVGADSLVLRWPNGSRIRIYQQPVADANLNVLMRSALLHAIREWEAATLFADFRLEPVSMPEQADVILLWSGSGQPLPVDVSNCPPGGANAYTTFCLTRLEDRLQPFPLSAAGGSSNVRFLVSLRASEAGSAQRVNALVTHELGHVLGLARHSPSSTDLMFSDPGLRSETNARDRATLQILYRTRPDIVP